MRKIKGKIIKASVPKMVTVLVERKKIHPLYQKALKASKKYLAHSDLVVKIGDWVEIGETRPISKTKCWQIIKVLKK